MKIYTIEEIAKILKCSERQIFRYLASGQLHGSKQGKWRFTEDDIKKFLVKGRKRKK
jgi:excisionase family DNA binding protein